MQVLIDILVFKSSRRKRSSSSGNNSLTCLSLNCRWPFGFLTNIFKAIAGPRYSGKYLHELLKEKLGKTRLHQTLTNVVIPTYDIKRLQPIIFSTYKVLSLFMQTYHPYLLSLLCLNPFTFHLPSSLFFISFIFFPKPFSPSFFEKKSFFFFNDFVHHF